MREYEIIVWQMDFRGNRKEALRSSRMAQSAVEALRAYYGAAANRIRIEYDEGADEALHYTVPASKRTGCTARRA